VQDEKAAFSGSVGAIDCRPNRHGRSGESARTIALSSKDCAEFLRSTIVCKLRAHAERELLTIFPTRISRVTFIAWFPRIAQLTFVACFRVFRLNVLEQSPPEKQSDNTCELRFSNGVYSIGAIKKAAYRFTDRCSFDFQPAEGNTTLAILSFSPDVTADEKAALQREFRNEVLDQDLREVIGAETAGVRNAVLAYAFSRTGLQGGDAV
jgi:His-Xaa-Ser system protein HxsD